MRALNLKLASSQGIGTPSAFQTGEPIPAKKFGSGDANHNYAICSGPVTVIDLDEPSNRQFI